MERVVITGATSMIGVALTAECLKNDIEVYAVVRPGSQKVSRLWEDERLHIVECALEQLAMLPERIEKSCDTFYHIAWGHTGAARNASVELQSNNIMYTMQAIRAAKNLGCRRFIGAGSQAEYGVQNLNKIKPDTPTNPTTPYGVSKLAAGQLAFLLCGELGLQCIWPRIFSVYGIYDKESSMITGSLRKMLQGEPTAFTKGEQRWDYLYSKDAGRAFYLLGEKGKDKAVYCIGYGCAFALADFICKMKDGVDPSIIPGIGKIPYPAGVIMNLCADISSLQEDTGFTPEYSFDEGIKDTIEWLRRTTNEKENIGGYPYL